MTLRIDEAERAARAARFNLHEGEAAIDALTWLENHASGVDDLAINCRSASALKGHKEAMAYLNIELGEVMADLIEKAKRNAQRDMDRCFGARL